MKKSERIGMLNREFPERIINNHNLLPMLNSMHISTMPNERSNHYPMLNLTYALPLTLKQGISNKIYEKTYFKSTYNNNKFHLEVILPLINYQSFKTSKTEFYNYTIKRINKLISFNTEHANEPLNYFEEFKGKTLFPPLNRVFDLKISDMGYDLHEKDHLLINKPEVLNKYQEARLTNEYFVNIDSNSLNYNYPSIEHLKTINTEINKEKIINNEFNSKSSTNEIKPPKLDMDKVANQVYSLIERKIKIERERRGLSA